MSPKFRQEDGYTLPPPTSVSVLMINAQGMMLSVLGQDYFVSYNRVPWLRDPASAVRSTCAWQDRTPSNGLNWT